jgi:hypothetical protein
MFDFKHELVNSFLSLGKTIGAGLKYGTKFRENYG